MTSGSRDRPDDAGDPSRVHPGLGAVALGIGAAVLWYLVLLSAPPDVFGSWVGRDDSGAEVVYSFDRAGTGFRVLEGHSQPFAFDVMRGDPTILTLTFPSDVPAVHGIVEADSILHLEFAEPGEPAPRAFSARSLSLRRLTGR